MAGTVFDITERKQAEAIRTQFAAIVQSSKEAIIGVAPDGTITSWNPGAETVYGHRAEEMIGQHISALAPPERKAEPATLLGRVGGGEAVIGYETERIRKDGARIDVSLTLSPMRGEAGNIVGVSTIARDITEKMRAERALRRVNRTLMMLSSCNEALVRAASEQQLLDEICRAITEIGGYQLAWVGYAQESPDRTVGVAARAGTAAAYLDGLRFAWDDSPQGRSPTGTAIRRGERAYINDFAMERRSGAWCRRAGELGLRSCIALPLAGKGRVVGALTLRSDSAAILTDEEIALRTERRNPALTGAARSGIPGGGPLKRLSL
jgi:PAS domain S-box-containing protein